MPKLFISYRRNDSDFPAHQLYEVLVDKFGQESVFIDVDTIPPGVDFRTHLKEWVGRCDVLLAVVGSHWLEARHSNGTRRLDDPRDFVRIEITAALERQIPVIPVLVGRVSMPNENDLPPGLQEFSYRNAVEVRSGRDFDHDVGRMLKGIDKLLQARSFTDAKKSTPGWKILEPNDDSDPVEHETCGFEVRSKDWNIMAASVRGKLHSHKAMWREDAFAYDYANDWTIIAVSDGAGSAPLSRVGATIACEESVDALKTLLADYCPTENADGRPTDDCYQKLRRFLVDGARKAQLRIFEEARSRDCSPRDLHTTLLLTIHAPLKTQEVVAAIQIGDGEVSIFKSNQECTLLRDVASDTEFSSETRFLTAPNVELEFPNYVRLCVLPKTDILALAVMSDGVSDDFFPAEKRMVDLFTGRPIQLLTNKNGKPLDGVLHEIVKNPNNGNALREWLKYELKGSSDDRTLVLMYSSSLTQLGDAETH